MKEWTGIVIIEDIGFEFEATVYLNPPESPIFMGSWEGHALMNPGDAFRFFAQAHTINTNIGEIAISKVSINGLVEFKGSGPPRGPISQ